jgi:hypothetical protein
MFYSRLKATTASFLFALDQEDKVHFKCTSPKEFRCCTRNCEYGTFVIGHSSAVKITVASIEREGVRRPAICRCGDNIVVAST